jgi:phage FluMu protein Com
VVTEECKELRCQGCGKLLAEKAASGTVIVCSRCKTRTEASQYQM